MTESTPSPLGNVITIDDERVRTKIVFATGPAPVAYGNSAA